jgi:[protein-PII] uridylyltransferase
VGPSAIVGALTAELASLDAEALADADGRVLAATRTAAYDRAVIALFEPFAGDDVSVAAIGGYGRREMTPGSDLDVLLLYAAGRDVDVESVARGVLYPLWDAGIRASQAVRTVEECRTESAGSLATLTAMLDARALSGRLDLVEDARAGTLGAATADVPGFVASLRSSRSDREERFGSVGERLEPHLKEGLGGLRDVQVLRWLRLVGLDADEPEPGWNAALLRWRTALHRVAGPGTDRLAADHHEAVAELLGVPAEPGWEPRDALLREISSVARAVALRCDDVLDDAEGRTRSGVQRMDPSADANESAPSFLTLLRRDDVDAVLRRMDVLGDLEGVAPSWGDVRGRPQRDPYHRFPVDTHLIEAAAAAGRLLRDPNEPFAAEAVRQLDDEGRAALVLGSFLHDIGKVGRGSHVALGADLAATAVDRMAVAGPLREDVLFLVREHLLLSDTATRRNVGDEDVVLRVASRVGGPRRLALLYLLTVADARATGPAASTPWRMGLIRELVARVETAFQRGLMDPGRASGLERAQAAVRAALRGLPPSRVQRFLDVVPTTYLLTTPAGEARPHVDLVLPPPTVDELRIHLGDGRLPGSTALAVAMVDRLGVLASIAGALTIAGLSITSAQVFTTETGTALDLFDVRGAFELEIAPERWERFRSALSMALSGEIHLAERVRGLRTQYRPPPPGLPVSVRVSGGASDFFTVVEVEAADRLGLLFDLCRAFADLGVDVHSARVATYGPRVVDVFDVTDEGGVKVTDEGRVVSLERALRVAAGDAES